MRPASGAISPPPTYAVVSSELRSVNLSREIDLVRRQVFENHLDRALNRAKVVLHDTLRIFAKLFPALLASQQFADRLFQSGGVPHADRAVFLDESLGNRLEVLHVRAEHDGLGQRGRLNRVLAASGRKA